MDSRLLNFKHAKRSGSKSNASGMSAPTDAAASEGLNARESEVYDRQIRLWGVQVQQRMSNSKILYAGFKGVCAETAKNMVLAGISATIQDSEIASNADMGTNFFLTGGTVGKNRAAACQQRVHELNTLATVQCESQSLEQLPDPLLQRVYLHLHQWCISQAAEAHRQALQTARLPPVHH